MENFLSPGVELLYQKQNRRKKIKRRFYLGFFFCLGGGGGSDPLFSHKYQKKTLAAFQVQIARLFNLVAPARAPCGFQNNFAHIFLFLRVLIQTLSFSLFVSKKKNESSLHRSRIKRCVMDFLRPVFGGGKGNSIVQLICRVKFLIKNIPFLAYSRDVCCTLFYRVLIAIKTKLILFFSCCSSFSPPPLYVWHHQSENEITEQLLYDVTVRLNNNKK